LGAALLLPAGAAVELSAGADGDCGGGLSPPHAATMTAVDAMVARNATIAMFFMIVFLLQRSSKVAPSEGHEKAPGRTSTRTPLCLSFTGDVNHAEF
jgi:hypothetical protein